MSRNRFEGPVAVAGGLGFLGSNVVEALRARGVAAVAFSRRTGVDLRDYEALVSFLRKSNLKTVINCAAHVGGIAYNALKPLEVYEDNLLMGFNLLRASLEAGVKKFVNVMPNCTYPGEADVYRETEWWNGPMHETVLTYGMPRKALWVHAWAMKQKAGFDSIHLVLPNLYGPGDHFDPVRSHALGALIKKIVDAKDQGSGSVEIWGTGAPIREWGFVRDAAEGIVRSMEEYDDIEIMNIGQGIGYTIVQIAEMVRESAKWDGTFTFDRSRPDGAPKKILDVSKMRKTLAWEPPTDIKKGIAETVDWYASHR